MIIALTPFPSLEYIYSIEKLEPNELLYSKDVSLNILSKGVYAAQIIKILQEEPILISSFGGFVGKSIKHYLDKSKIKSDIIWTDYETPHQVKILLQRQLDYYTVCSKAPDHLNKELEKLTNKLSVHLSKVSTLILSGKIGTEQEGNIFKEWIHMAKRHNIKVIVSTGQAHVWSHIIEEKPYALFLTEEQLRTLSFKTETLTQIITQLVPYIGGGLHFICIYLKDRGALLLSKHHYCHVQAPFRLLNQNNTAASGAFLGALAVGINRKYEQERMVKLGLAAALSINDNVLHRICNRKEIEYRYKKTRVKNIVL